MIFRKILAFRADAPPVYVPISTVSIAGATVHGELDVLPAHNRIALLLKSVNGVVSPTLSIRWIAYSVL